MQLSPEFLRFLAVGVLNTVFAYTLFALLSWIGLAYPLAIGLATVVGVAFNFQSTGRLVFGQAPLSRFARFVGVYAVLYLLNASAVIPLAMLAFLLQRRFVFPKS